MTIEEAQQKIIDQQTTIDSLNTTKVSLESNLATIKGDNEKLSNEIKTLREHNMRLFLKVSSDIKEDDTQKTEEIKAPSIDDLLLGF